ncbi:MAG TPA: tectonin domain-containing protein [Pyrinomonadaceae bacterium]
MPERSPLKAIERLDSIRHPYIRTSIRKETNQMQEENIGGQPDSEESEATGAEAEARTSVDTESSDDQSESPWVPGVVEVEFREGIEPEVIPFPEDDRYKVQSLVGRNMSEVNQLLAAHNLIRADLTFQTLRDEAKRLKGMALQQGIGVPALSDFVTLYFPADADVEQIARELMQLQEVAYASPVPQSEPPVAVATDELLGNSAQLPLKPRGLDNQWYIFRCRADRAWKLGFTGKGVVLIDIDWGYQVTHPELERRLDPTHRYNSVDRSSNISFCPKIAHGTAVMGLAGAGADGSGMIGFAHEAELWAIQANIGAAGTGAEKGWKHALEWVLLTDSEGKRKVILLEKQIKGRINCEADRALNVIIQTAIANGVVVCVPAGNGGRDAGLGINDVPIEPTGSILIGATMYDINNNNSHSLSNWGPRVVVSAPGDDDHDVTCKVTDGSCDIAMGLSFKNNFGGTSGAAAKVAGAVALMLQANPYIRHSDVREILNRTGTHIVTANDGRPIGRFLDCEAAVLAARLAPAWGTIWRPLPGTALDLVFSPDGSAWHLGTDGVIYQWSEEGCYWITQGTTDSAVKIAVGASGNPWYVNSAGNIFRRAGNAWQQVPGEALDISVGANGSVWRVGLDNRMYRWRNGKWEADSVCGSAVKIAVGPDGSPWHISNPARDIYKRVNDTWQQVPGQAIDIAIGANGSVWRVGLNETGDGNAMARWNGSDWEPIEGAATIIAVAPNGLPWHVNRSGDIFRRA